MDGVATDVLSYRLHRAAGSPHALTAVSGRQALGALVGLAFAVRWLLSLTHITPYLMPDEYIYGSIARSIAETASPLIRGGAAGCPALLQPILTAPFWLLGDPEAALRLTQGLHSLAMSLAAVPAYLLARRLELGTGLALAAAAFTVVSPDLAFAGYVLADPIAYPLVLAALYVGVLTLEQPTARRQLVFLGLSGLATFARVQFVVLPAVFLAAAVIVERGSIPTVVRRLRLTLALMAAAGLLVLTLGTERLLGYYAGVVNLPFRPSALLRWAATDAMLLVYPAGVVLVPGALLGVVLAVYRPASRTEAAFSALAVPMPPLSQFTAAREGESARPKVANAESGAVAASVSTPAASNATAATERRARRAKMPYAGTTSGRSVKR